MGLLKNARQRAREVGSFAAHGIGEGTENGSRFFDLSGICFRRYKPSTTRVNTTRLAQSDPATWSLVWRCIKRSRPHLAALLMDPQLARWQKFFNAEGVYVDFNDALEGNMQQDAYYIDTRDGANTVFTPPPKIDDYGKWIRTQYAASQGVDGNRVVYFGLAQKVNALITQADQAQRSGATALIVRAIGPHAVSLQAYLAEVSSGLIQTQLLD